MRNPEKRRQRREEKHIKLQQESWRTEIQPKRFDVHCSCPLLKEVVFQWRFLRWNEVYLR